MTESAKPLACPFCGGEAKFEESESMFGGGFYHCANQHCRIEARTFDMGESKALELWNHRAADPRLAALETTSKAVIAGLEAQIRDLKLELKMKEQKS
jgi:hypothetical protein